MSGKAAAERRAALQRLADQRRTGVGIAGRLKEEDTSLFKEVTDTEYASMVDSRRQRGDFVVDDGAQR